MVQELTCQSLFVLGSNWIWTVPVLRADEKTEDEEEEEALGGTVEEEEEETPLLTPSSASLMSTWMRASPVGEANSLCFRFLLVERFARLLDSVVQSEQGMQ